MAVLRKLRYCPICGSYVTFDYSNGAVYSAITWRCRKQSCVMSRDDNFLHEWNEDNKRSIAVWLRQIVGAIPWWFYWRWAGWRIWQAGKMPEEHREHGGVRPKGGRAEYFASEERDIMSGIEKEHEPEQSGQTTEV